MLRVPFDITVVTTSSPSLSSWRPDSRNIAPTRENGETLTALSTRLHTRPLLLPLSAYTSTASSPPKRAAAALRSAACPPSCSKRLLRRLGRDGLATCVAFDVNLSRRILCRNDEVGKTARRSATSRAAASPAA